MTIGVALLLIAVGAVLRFAVSATSLYGINLPIVGDILLAVGFLGLVIWLVVWAPWAHSHRSRLERGSSYQPQPTQYPGRRVVPPTDARTRELYQDPYSRDRYPN